MPIEWPSSNSYHGMLFQRGDIVSTNVPLHGPHGIIEGQAVVLDTNPSGEFIRIHSGDLGWYHAKHFNLVRSNPMSDSAKSIRLDDLIETINRGYAAQKELQGEEFRGIELWAKDTVEGGISPYNPNYCYPVVVSRKKPPIFEPFYIHPLHNAAAKRKPWKVELKGEYVHIGCKQFKATHLKQSLTFLLKSDGTADETSGMLLQATRSGILPKHEGIVSWEDADKILVELIKAGI